MTIHLHTLSNQIGIFTLSQERFLSISQALNEPCVWLNHAADAAAQRDYEVVIIDRPEAPPGERRGKAREDSAPRSEDGAGRRQAGLVVYQCPDGTE